jgi:hypothetical protein
MVVEEKQKNDITSDEEIEKRKPKPFRYISSKNEIDEILSEQTLKDTIMTDEQTTSKKLRENFESTIGIGDMDIIEQVIQKHKNKRDNEQNLDIV